MSVRAVGTLAELTGIIAAPQLSVVDFFATWCGPCKAIAPRIDQLAQQKPHVQFLKVDVDHARDIAMNYRIQAMPTFMLFKAGAMVEKFEGADWQRLLNSIQANEKVAPVVPGDSELAAMSAKALLQLMQELHIPSQGLPEKTDLIEALKKYR